jgi:putative flippase GtrA
MTATHKTLVRFALTGTAAAGVFFALTLIFVRVGLPPFIASIAAFGIAFMTSYALQRGWTFGARHRHLFAFPRYLALQVLSCLVSACIADAAITRFGFSPLAMSAVTTLFTGAISFLGSAFWVFADRTFPRCRQGSACRQQESESG